jgi:hypothetical protein
MVTGELRNGPLTKSRRRRLVQYAAMLDISALDAGDLVGEAQRRLAEIPTDAEPEPGHAVPEDVDEPWPLWVKLSIVVAGLAVLDAAFFHSVF